MASGMFYPGNIISLHRKAADRLLSADNGDAALLYLCLLEGKDASALKWEPARLEQARLALVAMKLADPDQPIAEQPPQKPVDERPPDYTTQDVAQAMQNGGSFAGLVTEVERMLGKVLSHADTKTLLLLHDYLALPPEVILVLVGWCGEQTAKKYGPGRKPTMPQIKREGNKWYKAGVTTLDAADAYLQRQQRLGTRGMEIMAAVGIHRAPVPQEEEYLDGWVQMDFPDEVFELAANRTKFQLGVKSINWAYTNGILTSWQSQGLRTVAAIQASESRRKPNFNKAKPAVQPESTPPSTSDVDRMFAELSGQTIPGKEG